jgi:hypothetical protein
MLTELLDTLPTANDDQEFNADVEGLRALRKVAGKAQADIAAALHIKQPSVSKIEKQADMHISTLRSYIEAIGGELDLVVRLPSRPAMRLHHLGDAFGAPPESDRSDVPRPVTAKRATARA